ncbi:hypothetical protein V498_02975, partial [Pseudogymnoascus sp. VKM F-4517 (FW-2822)]
MAGSDSPSAVVNDDDTNSGAPVAPNPAPGTKNSSSAPSPASAEPVAAVASSAAVALPAAFPANDL